MLRIVLWVVRFMLSAFAVWVVLTTVVPQTVVKYTDPLVASQRFGGQTAYPHWLLPGVLRIQNSTVWFVIAHPDDEVMFFAPSVIELAKPKNGNDVKLLCFLRGAAVDVSMGEIRARELHVLARILGVGEVVVLDYEDGMKVEWDADAVARDVARHVAPGLVVVTFDVSGVSGHRNHVLLYHGVRRYGQRAAAARAAAPARLLGLKSANFFEKYSFTLLTSVELFVEHVLRLVLGRAGQLNVRLSMLQAAAAPIIFYSDLNMLAVAYAAMAAGHFLQMVWFRYGWLVLSRYLTFNQLVDISV